MKKTNAFLTILTLLVAIFSYYLYDSSTKEIIENSIVTNIIDGDTIVIVGGERVRLLGVDTPEKGEYMYKEAKARLEQLVEQKEVTLIKENENKDKYDRLLRWVFLNETNVNLVLIQEGLARCYFYGASKYQKQCAELEITAIKSKLGLWVNSS
jgi:micrococcal nuclease